MIFCRYSGHWRNAESVASPRQFAGLAMSDEPPTGKDYQLSVRLLARKGSAVPLQAKGEGTVLSRGADDATADERLTEAIVESTLELLTAHRKRKNAPKAPAALTDLFDSTLVEGSQMRRKI